MSTTQRIGGRKRSLKAIREEMEARTLNTIREALPDRAIEEVCEGLKLKGRKRLLTTLVVVLHMVFAALWPESSFAASWQVLWANLVGHLPEAKGESPGSGSLANARKRVPLTLWESLFAWLSEKAQTASEGLDRWRGLRLILLDGTTVSMPDHRSLFEAFGQGKGKHGKFKYPVARLVALSLANTMTVIAYRLGKYVEGEAALAWEILPLLRPDDLLISDRHFAAAHYYARHLAQGVHFLTRVHQRLKVSRLKRLRRLGKNDFVALLPINKKYLRDDPTLPEFVEVRLIQAVLRIRGRRTVEWLVTSLLDPVKYPAEEVVALYARRWRIETLFREVKVSLGADVLRSKTPHGIRKEIIARLMAVNIVRITMLEAAKPHGVDPLRLSFSHAVRAIIAFAPAMSSAPLWKLPAIYDAMLTEIATHQVPYRPNRNEPRAIRRRNRLYPSLTSTRIAWRLSHAA